MREPNLPPSTAIFVADAPSGGNSLAICAKVQTVDDEFGHFINPATMTDSLRRSVALGPIPQNPRAHNGDAENRLQTMLVELL